jgi:hypothetical protein
VQVERLLSLLQARISNVVFFPALDKADQVKEIQHQSEYRRRDVCRPGHGLTVHVFQKEAHLWDIDGAMPIVNG